MRLSYSSISMYQNCPLSYKLRYIDRLPTKRTPQLCFGSSIHAVLAYFYDVPHPQPCSLDQLLNYIPEAWESDGYPDSSEEQIYLERAKAVLTQFYHTNVDDFQIPIALEHRFEIKLDSCTLSGIIDRVDKLPNGNCEVIDYKTSKKMPPIARINDDLQLSIYHMACQEVFETEPEKLSLYFLIPNKKVSTQRTDNDIEKTKVLISRTCQEIEAGKFKPRQNRLCPWCDFQIHCPFHKDKFAKLQISAPANTTSSIENIANEFVTTREEMKNLNNRFNELKEIILTHLEKNQTDVLDLKKGSIHRNKRVTQSYNVNKLKDILQPLGLWEKIQTVDVDSLKDFINSDFITEEIRSQILGAVEEEYTQYSLFVRCPDQEECNKKNS